MNISQEMRMPSLPFRSLAFAVVLFASNEASRAAADSNAAQVAASEPDPIEGTWIGRVTAPQGSTEIGFGFSRARDGKLLVRFHMPYMHAYGVDLGPSVEKTGSNYEIKLLDTQLTLAGEALTGTFAIPHLPMELRRGGAFSSEPAQPQFPAGPERLWSRSLGAPAWASPVARDGNVFVGTTDGKFHAVRTADGSDLWTWSGPNRIDGAAYVTKDAVYFVDAQTDLVRLDRASGSLVWRAALHDSALVGKPAPQNETFNHRAVTPVVIDDVAFAGSTDGGIYAVEIAAGKIHWRRDAKAHLYAGAARVGEDRLVFTGHDGSVLTIDRKTGDEISRVKLGGPIVSTPAIAGNIAVVGSRDYMLYGINLATGSIAWRYSYWFSWVESSPRLFDGVAYVGSSDLRRITAIDPASGLALWSTDVLGCSWGSPVVTNDTVFAGTSGQTGVLLKHQSAIIALDRKSGAVRWRVPLDHVAGAPIFGCVNSLALAGDRLIAATVDGTLLALPAQ